MVEHDDEEDVSIDDEEYETEMVAERIAEENGQTCSSELGNVVAVDATNVNMNVNLVECELDKLDKLGKLGKGTQPRKRKRKNPSRLRIVREIFNYNESDYYTDMVCPSESMLTRDTQVAENIMAPDTNMSARQESVWQTRSVLKSNRENNSNLNICLTKTSDILNREHLKVYFPILMITRFHSLQ